MAPLFKDANATLEQALDLARRGEFDRSGEKFLDAARKFENEGSIPGSNRARAYAELFSPGVRANNPQKLVALSGFLRSTLGNTELKPGPRGVGATDLAAQLELTARELNLLGALSSGGGDRAGLAQALQALANDYRQLGDQVLFLPELFNQRAEHVSAKVPMLMALSFETLGTATQALDPLAAAEHFQTAQQYWTQAGNETRGLAASARVESLALQAKCWLCGREGRGHGIQFVSLPIDKDVSGLKVDAASPLPSLDRAGAHVYACNGCFSALHGLADRVAVTRASEVEDRLERHIHALEQRINSLSGSTAFQHR